MNNSFKDGMIVATKYGWEGVIIGDKVMITKTDGSGSGYVGTVGTYHDKNILHESREAWQCIGWTKEHKVKKLLNKLCA